MHATTGMALARAIRVQQLPSMAATAMILGLSALLWEALVSFVRWLACQA